MADGALYKQAHSRPIKYGAHGISWRKLSASAWRDLAAMKAMASVVAVGARRACLLRIKQYI